jgi:hypothetical protein
LGKCKDKTISGYRKFKLKILERDFCIHISEKERIYAETLTTEVQIDQFFLGMINKYWG